MLVVSSFFASKQYYDYKEVVQEKKRLDDLIDFNVSRKSESLLSLLKIFGDRVKKSFYENTDAPLVGPGESNPTFGQCSISALVVQHFFGGEIMETELPEEWQKKFGFNNHFWNRIAGQDIDFTKEQFPPDFPYDDLINGRLGAIRPRGREYLLANQKMADNYGRAMKRLEKILF